MRGANSKSMTDVELMNLAKKRIRLRNSFKWHSKIYAVAIIVIIAMYFLYGDGHFWPVLFILGWGLVVALHGVSVNIGLSDSCPIVADEYNRLKGFAIVAEKMNGGISSEENNRG